MLEIDNNIMSSMTRIYSFGKWKQINAHGDYFGRVTIHKIQSRNVKQEGITRGLNGKLRGVT